MARPVAALCTLLLAWLGALGVGPVRHPAFAPAVARSAVELAMRDVADSPRLVSRVVVARVTSSRATEREAPRWQLANVAATAGWRTPFVASEARATLGAQALAHAARPRWRVYDPAAPPLLSRPAR